MGPPGWQLLLARFRVWGLGFRVLGFEKWEHVKSDESSPVAEPLRARGTALCPSKFPSHTVLLSRRQSSKSTHTLDAIEKMVAGAYALNPHSQSRRTEEELLPEVGSRSTPC